MNSSDGLRCRKNRQDFPFDVKKLTQISIPVDDNVQLAATIWLPQNKSPQSNENEKFATILEYLPYRKADWTSERDEVRLKYFSGFGYASLRVDIRGTGNSQGIFDDEYSEQELSDGLKILEWIQNQQWSNGKVVIYGKSWGGFNGLQIAYLQPKNLCGVISAYSTDDRYNTDIHYYGGCLAAQEALSWSTQMLLWLCLPPHPIYQGGIEKDSNLLYIWKERLNNLIPLDCYWIQHQSRDSYWRHGSICEDYARVSCPVFLIGGFADLYYAPIFRLMNQLTCSKRAILGPWGHQWPDAAYPGPQIGYLQELVEWLDYHIKGMRNGHEDKEIFSIYKLNPNIDELQSRVKERRGSWIHSNQIPSYPTADLQRNNLVSHKNNLGDENHLKYYLDYQSLVTKIDEDKSNPKNISFQSPQETGIASGNLLGWGNYQSPDHAVDQREDDGRSLCFDSLPIDEDYDLFGFPTVKLNLSSNTNYGLICVRLCMIDEHTSSSILVSRGILNLTHHKSHENPQLLLIDQIYHIEIALSPVCVTLPAGCRLRLALSTSYWPIVWPSSHLSILTIHFDQSSPCCLFLPRLKQDFSMIRKFHDPEVCQGVGIKQSRNNSISRCRKFDEINQVITLKMSEDHGSIEYPDGIVWDETSESTYLIKKNDPQSARVEIKRSLKYEFHENQSTRRVRIETESTMFTKEAPSAFEIEHRVKIFNDNESFFQNNWAFSFPKLHY